MDKIKIVHFVGSMNLGGTETLLMNILRNINRDKYEFIFMENVSGETYYAKEIAQLNGAIIKTPVFSLKNFFEYYKFLVEYFRNNNINIVHSHTYLHSWIILAAAKKAGVQKRIAHAHSAMTNYDNGSELKKVLSKKLLMYFATDLIACSEGAKKDLFDNSDQTIIIKNPVDLSSVDKIDFNEATLLKKELQLNNNEIIIGHIGRIVNAKNPMFICEIANFMKDNGIKFKLLWLGDGERRREVEQYIKLHGLENNIVMLGNKKNVALYINLFDIFILPSLYEGLSLSAVEVQAQGVPCLFSDTISIDSKINDNVQFLPINSASLWVQKIMISGKSPKDRNARANILKNNFDVDSTVKRIEQCYQN